MLIFENYRNILFILSYDSFRYNSNLWNMLLSFFESMILHLFSISKCGSVVLLHKEYGHSVSQNVLILLFFAGRIMIKEIQRL